MKADIRRTWEYKGCKVLPIDCATWRAWGKHREPIRFRSAYRHRFWRIEFPDESWVEVEFKADARKYIDEWRAKQ